MRHKLQRTQVHPLVMPELPGRHVAMILHATHICQISMLSAPPLILTMHPAAIWNTLATLLCLITSGGVSDG